MISSGVYHTCALRSDGSPVCWGRDRDGQDSPPEERFASINGGRESTCALRSDGSAVCWGSDYLGQVSPPEGELFASLGSGSSRHTCALRPDGSPVCWGNDDDGQASPPENERFASVSGGEYHTCALRHEGTAVCWGSDEHGQSSPPEGERFAPTENGATPAPTPPPTPTPEPTLTPTLEPTSAAAQGQCSAYDSTVAWLEAPYLNYSICYTAEYAADVAFVKRWIDHAEELMLDKYQADLRNARGRTRLYVNVILLPEPNDQANTGKTGFYCCQDASGRESWRSGEFAQIPYLTPSHPDWDARPTWGAMRLPPDDFHAKNLVHEFTHAGQRVIWGSVYTRPVPQWVSEGLPEYEGMFNATEHNRTVGFDSLVRYVHDRIPDRIFLAKSLGSDQLSLTTSDVYFGGALILKYLADKFGEDIHRRLVRHTHSTFDEAMAAEFEASGTTASEVFEDLQSWLKQHRQRQ